MSPRPLASDGVIQLFINAPLYGLYLTTLIYCLRWLVYTDDGWKLRDRINKPMLITSVLIFLYSTLDLAFMLQIELYSIGEGLSNIGNSTYFRAVDIIYVRKYHGWHLDQKSNQHSFFF